MWIKAFSCTIPKRYNLHDTAFYTHLIVISRFREVMVSCPVPASAQGSH
jgi:hypothetical protein